MGGKARGVCALAALVALAAFGGTRADVIIADQLEGSNLKAKGFDLKEGEKGTLKMSAKAGLPVTITIKGQKKTDVQLFVLDADKKEVAKDDSAGPDCKVTFTPKEDAELTVVVLNKGPGNTSATIKVDVGNPVKEKAKEKAKEEKGKEKK